MEPFTGDSRWPHRCYKCRAYMEHPCTIHCQHCDGRGKVQIGPRDAYDPEKCRACNGTGLATPPLADAMREGQ